MHIGRNTQKYLVCAAEKAYIKDEKEKDTGGLHLK